MRNNFYTYNAPFFNYKKAFSTNVTEAHFHKHYEIYYLLSGHRRYFIENEIFDIMPGDIVLIPEMTTHKVLHTSDSNSHEYHERFLLSPKREDIPEIFLPCFDTHFYRLPKEARVEIEACFQSIQARSEIRDAYTAYHNKANLMKILCVLACLPVVNEPAPLLSKKDLLMQEAALYIKNNFTRPLSLEELAQKFSFTKEYFSVLFKETTGFGFSEYVSQMRIAQATNLLISTSLSVTEIGSMCGFNDSNYFSKVFRKITGYSPIEFRRTHQQEKE